MRMTNLAHQFGKKINLSSAEMNKLSLLVTLHDINKTTISEDISFLSRIIAIMDAYDVMTNDRPYSKAIFKDKTLSEINVMEFSLT